jgi:mitochondrial fission protein ELM1
LRYVKRASGGAVFTVYLNRPATGVGTADLIIAPRHDGFSGANVLTPLTPPNRLTPERLATARTAPDPRIAALPGPVVGLLVGGDSRHFRFSERDIAALAAAVSGQLAEGWSVAATLSRRTPAPLAQALRAICDLEREGRGRAPRAFLWEGEGENPYLSLLACSDALLVTGDSVNMVSEAAATGTPVHVFAPGGGSAKIAAFLAGLEARGAARRWAGRPERWSYEPVNATPELAETIARAYLRFAREKSGGA